MISEVKTEAKEKMKGYIWKFWGVTLLIGLITSILENLPGIFGAEMYEDTELFGATVKSYTLLGSIWSFAVAIITTALSVVLIHYVLQIVRKKPVPFTESFKFAFGHILLIFLVSLLEGIFISLGFLLFFIPGIIVTLGLAMTGPIICDNPELGAMEVIKKSWAMMKGHKLEYLLLGLSFIGWILLCFLVIPVIYVLPYMAFAEVVYYTKLAK